MHAATVKTFRSFKLLIILWLVLPASGAFGALLLGAAPGATPGLKSATEVRRLAGSLADALGEQIDVRLFDKREQIGQWLNQHAMLDLAVFDPAYVAAHPGEFLVIGATDKSARLILVARQGITGDMPQRAAAALGLGGKVRDSRRLPEARPAAVSALAGGGPPEFSAAAAVSPAQLSLGLTADPVGVPYSQAEADRFAVMVGKRLGVSVRARLFGNESTLAEWFLRYRMIDLAVIAAGGRSDALGRNYQPLLRLSTKTATAGAPDLLVARLDLAGERLQKIRAASVTLAGVLDLDVTPAPGAMEPAAGAELPVSPPVEQVATVPSPAEPVIAPPQVPLEPPKIVELPSPGLAFSKSAAPDKVTAAGEVLTYRYELRNTGNVVLAEIRVTDAGVTVSCPADRLAPGEVLTCTGRYEVAAADVAAGSIATVATAMSAQAGPVTAEAVVSIEVPAPVRPSIMAAPQIPPVPVLKSKEPVPSIPEAVQSPVPPPAAEVAAAPSAPQFSPEPAPAPAEATAPPEPEAAGLPFEPVPPRVVEEAPAALPAVEITVVPPAPEPSPEPAPAPAEAAAPPEPEAAGLPFAPVPPQIVEETPAPAPPEPPSTVTVSDAPEPVASPGSAPPLQESAPAVSTVPEPADTAGALAVTPAVPDVIAQPDLPQELRPPGLPSPRPARLMKAPPPVEEAPVLLAKLPETLGRTPKPPPLLPEADPEPGIVYVAPFITLMVPTEVQERIFDQFVDTLNQRGATQSLKFVILKQGVDKTDRPWLDARKHALGEVYGYVEESGCCSTDIRARVRLTFYRAHKSEPALKFEYPVRRFFEHDQSTLVAERRKLADQIAEVLVDELFKVLQP